LMNLNAWLQVHPFFQIRYAITIVADLLTPAAQCTRIDPFSRPYSMN